MLRATAAVGVAVVLLIATLSVSISQTDEKRSQPPDPNDPLLNFSVLNSKDINLVVRAREKAIRQSTELLERWMTVGGKGDIPRLFGTPIVLRAAMRGAASWPNQ